MYVHNSPATAQILLDKAVKGDVIWSNETVKGLLQDIITLHAEVEHERKEKDHHRCEASRMRRERTEVRTGW